ncbi:cysteine-rich CWC family protein [Desertivirga brevis]|uniref:cysteine-rich CWC family protein n=1 Tax=Desertivirga brevis TaxID=2810310 RepID=UPI001A9603E8|nr:cysteine-rich CWC family protein [Pedobacter sp. SYSU D00873]
MTKHEIIGCERCRTRIECKANNFTQCQCSGVQLNLNEVQYISERYEGCLCANCLVELKQEYLTLIENADYDS